MINRKRTGAMLSPWRTHTLWLCFQFRSESDRNVRFRSDSALFRPKPIFRESERLSESVWCDTDVVTSPTGTSQKRAKIDSGCVPKPMLAWPARAHKPNKIQTTTTTSHNNHGDFCFRLLSPVTRPPAVPPPVQAHSRDQHSQCHQRAAN